jgi:transposase
MEVTTSQVGDHTQLGNLPEKLDGIESVSGDTGYLSRRNCELVEAKGATPYRKPRRHSPEKPIGPSAWRCMIQARRQNRHRWVRHYHRRFMAETAFSAIKRTLRHWFRSIRRDFQKLELMIKVIVYNITVLVKTRQKGL